MKVLKLGTRKSLLAWAQSSWVAREIERLNPGTRVELVGIETRGDRILDVSLQSVEGKEFFVAELDDALRSGRVDLTVHSMKDLSLERPATFVQAALPKRENPHDAILFGPGIMEKIGSGKSIRIGTSSPRRLENIPGFLARALPTVNGHKPSVQFIDIRGNVNTRLSRVHEARDSERHLDAVVLALAGLVRLQADEKGKEELTRLLQDVRWMILPLRECPTAAAQGALAIECRRNDTPTLEALAKLNCPSDARLVGRERALLAEWGGGCHQKFGATCLAYPGLGELFYVRGVKPDGAFVDELRWNAPSPPLLPGKKTPAAWDGHHWRQKETKEEPVGGNLIGARSAVFLAHSRAATPELIPMLLDCRLWTSGTASWFRLAERGLWIEGCAEGLGFDYLRPTLGLGLLGLPALSGWTALTHEDALEGWAPVAAKASYRIAATRWSDEALSSLQLATHIFWSSTAEFESLKHLAPAGAHHACGSGKTADALKKAGLAPVLFPNVEEWKKWLNI